MFQTNKDKILFGVAVLAIIVTGMLLVFNSTFSGILPMVKSNNMSANDIAQKSIDYLNKNVLPAGQTATLGAVSEESGIIKIKVVIGTASYDSYITKDGKLFFPEAFNLDSAPGTPATATTTKPVDLVKVEKPMLEAYVVSSCPYGLQMQRAMADAITKLPSLAQYIKVRYIGAISGATITAMHGVEEAQENLRQICIREEQQPKYWAYVGCYMQKATGTAANGMPYGDSKSCQTTAGIDTAKLNSCVADATRGLVYAKQDFDLSAKYNVSGSPTLILNGSLVSEFDFGGRTSEAVKTMVCDSSKTAPDFCKTALSTDSAATSFSLTYAAPASAGNASTNAANCAPATN